jgi:hypothetical protein
MLPIHQGKVGNHILHMNHRLHHSIHFQLHWQYYLLDKIEEEWLSMVRHLQSMEL